MKFISAFLLSIAFLLFSFKPFIPFINYALNRQYIIREFCINKDKPGMHCNGKCYLQKQIKALYDQQHEAKGDQQHLPKNLQEPDSYLLISMNDWYQKDCSVIILSMHSICLKSIFYLAPPNPPPKLPL